MKRRAYLVVLIGALLACTKPAVDPQPADDGEKVAGSYEISHILYDAPGVDDDSDEQYPQTIAKIIYSAGLEVERISATSVKISLVRRETGQKNAVNVVGTPNLRNNAVYRDTTNVGVADGKVLNLDFVNNDVHVIIESKKKVK
ncbi:hypothetical protein J2I47_14120 [Fibrella sp. HMF5335]|uniref:Lipocalin-like domain-containing protein n=1 Tax=Fibrella rubiginis TaxID=2817060 RepID=A0A939K6M1_9BACT|nr:hypothetical protein [Fibrella rubiginis]MBO0937690.1 hypothetical protein [Fibrella rubiginis]